MTTSLEYRFHQPFPWGYGLTKKGSPSSELKNLKGDMTRTLSFVKRGMLKSFDFLSPLKIENKGVCVTPLYFLSYDPENLRRVKGVKYAKELATIIERVGTPGLKFGFVPGTVENIDHNYSKFEAAVFRENQKGLKQLEECLKRGDRLIKLTLNQIIAKNKSSTMIAGKGPRLGHTYSLFITSDKRAYFLDTSGGQKRGWVVYGNLIWNSYNLFLKNYVSESIELIRPQDESCPSFNIQGKSGFCTIWSLYILVLTVLNPWMNKEMMYSILAKYTQPQRDLLMWQFCLYLYTTFSKEIKSEKDMHTTVNIILPLLTKGSHLPIYPSSLSNRYDDILLDKCVKETASSKNVDPKLVYNYVVDQ